MTAIRLALALLAVLAGPAARARDDGRIRSLTYVPDRTYELETATGNTLTVVFAPGERIQRVTVGQPQAFQVSVSSSADSLFVRPLGSAASSTMAVQSDRHTYQFMLRTGPMSGAIYAVRFEYDAPATVTEAQPGPATAPVATVGEYRLSGHRALRPSSIRDDGARTYIEWPEDQLLPAVFVENALGQEATADGYVRDGVYTIDRVHRRLIFRIDRRTARADRVVREVRP